MSATKAIALLRAAYPRAEFPDESVTLYVQMLDDLDDDAVVGAVKRLILGSTWLPSIHEIRMEAAEQRLALPTVEEAWDTLCTGSLRDAPPEVQAAARACGGRWAVMSSDNPEVVRAQFSRDYTARRERSLMVAIGARVPDSPAELPPPPPKGQLGTGEPDRVGPWNGMSPIVVRLAARMAGRDMWPPSEDEKRDAMRVLEEGPSDPDEPGLDPVYAEAERVLAQAGEEQP